MTSTPDSLARVEQEVKFSVVVPLFQKQHRIENCLASIRAQTLSPLETIVVDDGSTDGGGELVQRFDASWVRYFRQENQGVSVARNYGLSLARGNYVAFLDADDTWRPNHLLTLCELIRSFPTASILCTNWVGDGAIQNETHKGFANIVSLDSYLKDAINNCPPFWTGAVAIRKDALTSNTLFPVGSRIAEDQDAWITMLRLGNGIKSNVVTADYYYDPLNPTIAKPKSQDLESVIFNKWSTDPAFSVGLFVDFVASHRLYTIERHVGFTASCQLFAMLRKTKINRLKVRKLKVGLRIFLYVIGVIGIWRFWKFKICNRRK